MTDNQALRDQVTLLRVTYQTRRNEAAAQNFPVTAARHQGAVDALTQVLAMIPQTKEDLEALRDRYDAQEPPPGER